MKAMLGGDYMIPVGQDKILSYFAGILAFLYILHKLYLRLYLKYSIKAGSPYCSARIPLCRYEIFLCNRFNRLSGMVK